MQRLLAVNDLVRKIYPYTNRHQAAGNSVTPGDQSYFFVHQETDEGDFVFAFVSLWGDSTSWGNTVSLNRRVGTNVYFVPWACLEYGDHSQIREILGGERDEVMKGCPDYQHRHLYFKGRDML